MPAPSALAGRFPALRADDVAVAGVTEGAGYADPGAYTACLAENAVAEGATLATHTPVTVETDPPRVVPQNGSSRAVGGVLVAAGAHSKRLLAAAGVPIAMKPYRVQALVTAADVTEPMWYDATAGCYAHPHPDGLLAGNGTEAVEADPDTYDRDANPEFAASFLRPDAVLRGRVVQGPGRNERHRRITRKSPEPLLHTTDDWPAARHRAPR